MKFATMTGSLSLRSRRASAIYLSLGEMSEWSKVHAWKACVPKRYRGFESLSLRFLPRSQESCERPPPNPARSGRKQR